MKLKTGLKLGSAVDATEVIIVRAPADEVDLRCGGAPMVGLDEARSTDGPAAAHAGGTLLGKRYADTTVGLELLCTKAGPGSLSLGDTPLEVKEAKPLPASD